MKIYYPGVLMIPVVLLLLSALSLMDRAGVTWSYWPITLIATGLEELYLWSISKNANRVRSARG